MLEEARFVYGPIRAHVTYAGLGAAPPWERRKGKVRLWDVRLYGPGGAGYRFRDWSPADEKPDLLLLGSMVRSAIVELEMAYVDPRSFRSFRGHLPEDDLDAGIRAARRFGRHIRGAAQAALEHAERIGHGGDPAAARGPKEWWPGAD